MKERREEREKAQVTAPDNLILTQPGLDAINPAIGPFDALAAAAIVRAGGGAALSAIQKIRAGRKQDEQKSPKGEADDPVFKRPDGVPDDWVEKPVKKGQGKVYTHPEENGTYVRTQKGEPASSNPGQRYDNVRWQKNGKSMDVNGNVVKKGSQESHIPIEEFKFDLEKMK